MKKNLLTYLYLALILIGTAKVYITQTKDAAVLPADKKHIVIDAGHGGFDPGKVASDGTEEKTLNLAIAQTLRGYLEQSGAVVSMTRTIDEALADRKTSDLKERIKITGAAKTDIFVSIHQNSYPSPDVKGAQVFYYKNSENGKRLAEAVQARLKQVVAADNSRSAKPDGTYYILKNSDVPCIIVECGFLSNPAENENLKTEDCQKKIAWAIYMGINDYLEKPNV